MWEEVEPSERFYRRTRAEDDDDNFTGDADDSEPMTYRKHVALLAERAFRTCTNYYNESIKRNPDLDQELNEKVQMLYNSEMRFNTLERQKKEEDLIKEFNKRLLHQFNRIAPRIQWQITQITEITNIIWLYLYFVTRDTVIK